MSPIVTYNNTALVLVQTKQTLHDRKRHSIVMRDTTMTFWNSYVDKRLSGIEFFTEFILFCLRIAPTQLLKIKLVQSNDDVEINCCSFVTQKIMMQLFSSIRQDVHTA